MLKLFNLEASKLEMGMLLAYLINKGNYSKLY